MALTDWGAPFSSPLTESSHSVAFAFDIATNHFTYLNPAFETVWLKTRKSTQDNPASLLNTIHPDDRIHVFQAYEELLAGTLLLDMEFRIILRSHTQRWISVRPKLLTEQLVIVGFADDISAQKQHKETLQKFADKKNSILNILSHDLAGPFANIQSLATILAQYTVGIENEEIRGIINIIQQSSKQGMDLIQEFIRQEFLESAAAALVMVRVNLIEKLQIVMDEYLPTSRITGITFHFITSTDKVFLTLDMPKFFQVINNLVSNAIKFTPDGGNITISVEEQEDSVLIKVADTGIGIPAKYHATLFDKFTNARRPGIKGEPSVGLGMSIIKTIVEWHQGKIWFESQENKGTTFFIQVPKSIN
ncbi:PAS domain-containing sensor histidine kinase [Adhaeribacter arboris]|uniref:histidine kinase n=1 Tax=Adhaeribacter arboris TaxID=2072846 RepID=A0A2T2YEI9_9BACT|nr:HAMP domain-containing sensor histidine kinase [Adhaeribacter arboris]PSR53924.1 PAS domain-containing sensor histidine kinase [Adhaeribacter arboris]